MRRRLVVAIALVAAASVVLFALPLALVVRQAYRGEELLRLQRDAVAATRQIDLAPTRSDPVELPASTDVIGVYTAAGSRRAGAGPEVADAVVRDALRSGRSADATTAGRMVAAVPLVLNERVTGAIRVSRDGTAVARRVHRTWAILAIIALGVMLLAVTAAVIVGRRLARPLEHLATVAGRLGGGDFTVAAPTTGIPELDDVGSALAVTARRLEGLIARERAFSSDASHQLRTPLAALRLEIESMQLRPGAPEEVPRALEQVARLQRTIETLLTVARDLPRERGGVDPLALAHDLEARWTGPLAQTGRSFRVVTTTRRRAPASAEVVREILSVLVENAVEHGAGTVTVTLRDAPPDGVAIDVEDEGSGLAQQLDELVARHPGGPDRRGIGLSIAQALATAEGGLLVVRRARPAPIVTLLLPGCDAAPPAPVPLSSTSHPGDVAFP